MEENKDIIPNNENRSLVDLFKENPILTSKDLTSLTNCKDFIVDTYLSVPMYRTLPIKLFGVLNDKDFPSAESKFWQAKAEAEVHAKELVHELHDLEELKIIIDKTEYFLAVVFPEKLKKELDDHKKMEITFDMRQLSVTLSRKKFEYVILEKKIKYRIEEIDEWRKIVDKLSENFDSKNTNYALMLANRMINNWTIELNRKETKDSDKPAIIAKLKTLQEALNLKASNGNGDSSSISHN